MSTVTVQVLDRHLARLRRQMAASPASSGFVWNMSEALRAYADQLGKAPRIVLAGHLARLTLAALTGRATTATRARPPMCPQHQMPVLDGEPIAIPTMGCTGCARWLGAQ